MQVKSMDYSIEVENLSKVYKLYDKPSDRLKEALSPVKKCYHKDFYALKDLSFKIKPGETVGFVGKKVNFFDLIALVDNKRAKLVK